MKRWCRWFYLVFITVATEEMKNKAIMASTADIHHSTVYYTVHIMDVCISYCCPLSQIFSSIWEWDVNLMIKVIEVITFCLAGYSVQSWSRPPRGTAPLLLEGRRQASMSRL